MTEPTTRTSITAREGNAAALLLVGIQIAATATLRLGFGLPTGAALLITAVLTLVAAHLWLPGLLGALRAHGAFDRPQVSTVLGGFLLALLASRLAASGLQMISGETSKANLTFSTTNTTEALVIFIAGALLVPITEELAFRGLMLQGHLKHLRPAGAALTTGLLFGLSHGDPINGLPLALMGYVLARVALHTRRVTDTIAIHILNNAMAIGGLLLLSLLDPDLVNSALDKASGAATGSNPGLGAALLAAGVITAALSGRALPSREPPPEQERPQGVITPPLIMLVLYGSGSLLAAIFLIH